MTIRAACLVGILVLAANGAPLLAASPTAPFVGTKAGTLRGVREDAVDVFRGVPYAEAPVGALRWRAPVAAKSWSGVRPAIEYGASCYQEWPARTFGPYTSEFVDTPRPSEDCLYLNVWSPAQRTAKVPVMVWIHGGGFSGGSGALSIYDGTHLASQGIMVVTINYRVGPFGFLAHPELTREARGTAAGNYGLQDMIAALRWVQDNAAAFGGDAANVTIMGQSAGAMAVNALVASPQAKGLFARAIAQSGSGMGIPAIPLAEAENNGERLFKATGAATLTELRALPPEKIQSANPFYFGSPPPGTPPRIELRPVLDGGVLPADYSQPGAPVASAVPIITGFNADEFMPSNEVTAAEFQQSVRARYGADADRLLSLYPHATNEEAAQSARALVRDVYMTATYRWAVEHSRIGGRPVYAYLFTHPSPVAKPPGFGTFHSSEIPYLFGVLDRNHRPYDDRDEQIAKQLQSYWLSFIRTGDPNGGPGARWNPVDRNVVQVMGLGDDAGPRPPVSSNQRFQALMTYADSGGRLSIR
ncbi:para-nitrobenzyl esterase [Povalibacter uvarum]|uniref:Carboxylic ester hydrolase n=1 Tax=Povalibacter uvarum TaxID=732238 RepID=A0A841HSX5_9GAMM|nr:carboxylesterase family protein [Povalibacter uvarum]MBB6096501.1 para-nitrobenzyl esterase [Povalibacter uvarum]